MEFAQGPWRMLSGLGLGGFPGRGAPLKSSSADWLVCSGHASLLLIDSSLPAGSTSAAPAIALWIRPRRRILAAPPAPVPRGVVAAITVGKEAAYFVPPCQKPNTSLKRNLKVGKTTNLVQKAKHHGSGLNEQVWHIIRLDVRHAVSTQ